MRLASFGGIGALSLLLFGGCSSADDAIPEPGSSNGRRSPGSEQTGENGGGACGVEAAVAKTRGSAPALVVTSSELKDAFVRLARIHRVTGIETDIVTVEEICAGGCDDSDPKRDTPKAIKHFLRQRAGLRYVLLGGDTSVVPARRSQDSYTHSMAPSLSFKEDIVTDHYYGDLSEWDTNGDGTYGDPVRDRPSYGADLAVGRLPVKTASEVALYIEKVIKHLTRFDSAKVGDTLLLSNIATRVGNVDIDASFYFGMPGRTLSVLPEGARLKKLYATTLSDPEASTLTVAAETAELNRGYNIVVHAGHGSPDSLTVEIDGRNAFTGDMAHALENETLPLFLSCACQAGSLAANGNAAGAKLVTAPKGGAIAYVGNSATGLGLAGGSQLIDEMLRYLKTTPHPVLGDAYLAGRRNMPRSEELDVPLLGKVPTIDATSHRWTQKSVVLFGDPMLPVWTTVQKSAPAIRVKRDAACANRISFRLDTSAGNDATLRVLAGEDLYEVPIEGTTASLVLPDGSADDLVIGLARPGHFYGLTEVARSSLEATDGI
jgi:hypothetical protein